MLSDEHHTVISSTVLGPVKFFVFVKGMRKVLMSEME